ncbi:MAG: hypothetical protein II823_05455 [Kiritimatiellae bacterium]|nr:hypothetical protein [Kiritimatiellia bacterium]
MKNSIVEFYKAFKNVETFESLLMCLQEDFRMPKNRLSLDENAPLRKKCITLGHLFAQHYIMYHSVQTGRPVETVSPQELLAQSEQWGRRFFILLQSGSIKPLYLITSEASQYINEIAIPEGIDEQFLIDNLSKPLVLYSDFAHPLFDDVIGILLYYNQSEKSLDCSMACIDSSGKNGELRRIFMLDEITAIREKVVVEELNPADGFMFSNIVTLDMDEITAKFSAALMYAFKFIILRKLDQVPIIVESQFKRHNNPRKEKQIYGTLNYQRVSLTERCRYVVNKTDRIEETVTLGKEGKERQSVRVRGFIRRQHYGPGNSLTKFVYIEEHDSFSWIRVGLRIIKVKP